MINIKNNPGLIRLVKEDESLEDLQALPVESILLRWMNFHLENAGHDKRARNFSDDVKDSVKYTILLNQLDSGCDKTGLKDELDPRCVKVLGNAKNIGAIPFLTKSKHLSTGNPKLNMLFVASIFNACSGLEANEEERKEIDAAELGDADGDPREERGKPLSEGSWGS